MSKTKFVMFNSLLVSILFLFCHTLEAETHNLTRTVSPKKAYTNLPASGNDIITFKIAEGLGQPELVGKSFNKTGPPWKRLNDLLNHPDKSASLEKYFSISVERLNEMRQQGSARINKQLPDLSLYHKYQLPLSMSDREKIDLINAINELDIIEIAYFEPVPEIASFEGEVDKMAQMPTPNWESYEHYLQPAPIGVDAYYAWNYPGGKGENIKVIDIEGNWNQTHEDLHGGSDNFHIAGSKINDISWTNHGTAVLGEIAADSNTFGTTGIAFNVNLGTVSIGSLSTADALLTAINNSDTGDVILIELHAPGPHYNFESRSDQAGYVCMEYWQANFDAIYQASSLGRIVVEAAGNGDENFDDQNLYQLLFDPTYRFSGAILVGASNSSHVPASFSNYGQRLDAHGFGMNVYTLGYGDLYGSNENSYYTAYFSGTSSASPIVVGAVAVLEGVSKANFQRVLDHNEIRDLIKNFGTPQATHYKNIGPLPNLQAAIDQTLGVSFSADTTFGWVPLSIDFSATSVLEVDTWTWDFGDGTGSFSQNPTHVYDTAGVYNVSLVIDAAGDIRSASRQNYIITVADTTYSASVVGAPGDTVEIPIYANNTVPLRRIQIPFEYPGNLRMSFKEISIEGCRTEAFELIQLLHYDAFNRRISFELVSSNLGVGNELEPGSGLIAKVLFEIHSTADDLDTAHIFLDGYNEYVPSYVGTYISYDIVSKNGADVSVIIPGCCTGIRGNIDGDELDEIDISDIVYYVEYQFGIPTGPEPVCFEEADLDANEELDISDIVYMVEYQFDIPPGPEPLPCP